MAAQETPDEQVRSQFEFEDCGDCGRGEEGHMVGFGPFGEVHAVCKEDAY